MYVYAGESQLQVVPMIPAKSNSQHYFFHFKSGQYYFSSCVQIMETDNKDVLYSGNYLVALHVTIMFIALERKTKTVAAKKNTPVLFSLCKDTVVCF